MDGELRARSIEELKKIGFRIQTGSYEFDAEEVREIEEAARSALDRPPLKILGDVLMWLLPPILLIVVILWVARFSR